MTTGNGVPPTAHHGEDIRMHGGNDGRDDGSQLRDIEELVAKLQVVTRQLEFPARTIPAQAAPARSSSRT